LIYTILNPIKSQILVLVKMDGMGIDLDLYGGQR
jgi:hypothetical protein